MVAARSVPYVLCFQSPSATIDFRPSRFVSIEHTLDGKMDAIAAFASQASTREYLDDSLLRASARYWARFGGGSAVEPFEVVRDRRRPERIAHVTSQHAAPGVDWRDTPSMADRTVGGRPVRVLVTGAGGPSAVGIIRSLARQPQVALHAGDIDPNAAGLYLVPAERRVLLPRGDDPGFAETLLAWCRATGIDVVYPTVDQELLPRGAGPARVRGRGRSRWCSPRSRRSPPASTSGRSTRPPWTACRSPARRCSTPGFLATGWDGPVIVKPRRGSGSRGVHVVHDLGRLDDMPRDGSLLVQEYLPGAEHSLDVLASPTGTVGAVVPRLRLKVDSGVAVAAAPSMTTRSVDLGGGGRGAASGWAGSPTSRCAPTARRGTPAGGQPAVPGHHAPDHRRGRGHAPICLAMALGAPMPAHRGLPRRGHGPLPRGAVPRCGGARRDRPGGAPGGRCPSHERRTGAGLAPGISSLRSGSRPAPSAPPCGHRWACPLHVLRRRQLPRAERRGGAGGRC